MNPMTPMDRPPFNLAPPLWAPPFTPHFPPSIPPFPPPSASFWKSENVRNHLQDIHKSLNLGKALKEELVMLSRMKEREEASDADGKGNNGFSINRFSKFLKGNMIQVEFQESLSYDATNAIISKIKFQLEPFRVATGNNSHWEEKFAMKRLANNMMKYKRHELWRKRKRKRMAEKILKERELYDQVDKAVDEWRIREIARDIAQRKVEKMKGIAKLKAKEEKIELESELEIVMIVEKLQELRSIRIQKLKKQGHFLPEEDDNFLERVKAAVEEEERQAMVVADTDAAKVAITSAEESRKHTHQKHPPDSEELGNKNTRCRESEDQHTGSMNGLVSMAATKEEPGNHATEGPGSGSAYESTVNLPSEFYHYYHGSNTDMGTLIEVRRSWDAYIRPGGSRVPGHWVNPPPPADQIWASYLVKSKMTRLQ